MADDQIYDLAPEEPKRPSPTYAPIKPSGLDAGKPMPCPHCGYDLRGTPGQPCPECGNKVSQTRIRAERERLERKFHQQAWFPSVLTIAIGIAAIILASGYAGSSTGGGAAGATGYILYWMISLAISVVVGWVVYPVLAFLWIGWSSSIPTTALQLAGAYAGATATLAVLELTGLPIIPLLTSTAVLIGLLCKLMDVDQNDAVALAVISWGIKWMIAIFVLNAIIQSGGI